jgi:hypothetical protein
MLRFLSRLVLATAVAAGACGGTPSQPSVAVPAVYATEHFVFRHGPDDAPQIARTAAALEAQYSRIITDLGAASMPSVTVNLYRTHAALVAGAGPSAGPIPPWATGLVTAVDRIHIISPGVSGPYERGVEALVHEFAHCVSLRVNPRIANNPRWLWESIALYEAGQRVDPRTLAYLGNAPPSFERLNAFDNTMIYDVGYLISEFIVDRFGLDGLRRLLGATGDSVSALAVSPAELEREWVASVHTRYGL